MEPIPESFNREGYEHIEETGFVRVSDRPLSTFSVDVDTASYANVRRFLSRGQRPPPDAVRVEEMLNYFDYDYPAPGAGEGPFRVTTELGVCPWAPNHGLLHVGIRGRALEGEAPARNLVFLIDVSGSMGAPDKLPLLTASMALLARRLRPEDRVAIVVYAGAAGLVLPSTSGQRRDVIELALERLQAGGSTNGGQGIELAYAEARRNFIRGGVNRVILATDGDFNVGTTSHGELRRLIERKRESGVFLTVLGFGTGNLQDHAMETLADYGNGNYAYIDSLNEGARVLVREADATLITIAKDVKLQLEFNPRVVASYRLVGYENRRLAAEDFNDDQKDAGEIGVGHTVTALFEIVPAGRADDGASQPTVDPLRYQGERSAGTAADRSELATLKVRYKAPDGQQSRLLTHVVRNAGHGVSRSSEGFRFAAAVASFGMLLRGSEHRGNAQIADSIQLAAGALGSDPFGERAELIRLMQLAAGGALQ